MLLIVTIQVLNTTLAAPLRNLMIFPTYILEIWSFVKTKLKLWDIATDTGWFCWPGEYKK